MFGGIIFLLPLPLASGSLRDLRLFADATVLRPSNVLLSITIQPSKIWSRHREFISLWCVNIYHSWPATLFPWYSFIQMSSILASFAVEKFVRILRACVARVHHFRPCAAAPFSRISAPAERKLTSFCWPVERVEGASHRMRQHLAHILLPQTRHTYNCIQFN